MQHCAVKTIACFAAAGIRGEDAGTLVCYKNEDNTREEDKARLELKVLGSYLFQILSCRVSVSPDWP